jgi:phenylpropionate dioxygenase-like ring-hydroxylating dioxygenase large terminal subunit
MENMLDTPHLPWVHGGTIGASMAKAIGPESTIHQELTETGFGFTDDFRVDARPPARINWWRPNGMELFILDKPFGFVRMHAWCIPTTHNHTRMLVAGVMDFGWLLNPFLFVGAGFNKRVLGEDRRVLESSDPPRVPPPADEENVPTDKVTLRFRAWYQRTLAHLDDAADAAIAARGAPAPGAATVAS